MKRVNERELWLGKPERGPTERAKDAVRVQEQHINVRKQRGEVLMLGDRAHINIVDSILAPTGRAVLLARRMASKHPFVRLRSRLGTNGKPLSQQALGKALRGSQPAISQIENGRMVSHKLALAAFLRYRLELTELGISLEDLMVPRGKKRRAA